MLLPTKVSFPPACHTPWQQNPETVQEEEQRQAYPCSKGVPVSGGGINRVQGWWGSRGAAATHQADVARQLLQDAHHLHMVQPKQLLAVHLKKEETKVKHVQLITTAEAVVLAHGSVREDGANVVVGAHLPAPLHVHGPLKTDAQTPTLLKLAKLSNLKEKERVKSYNDCHTDAADDPSQDTTAQRLGQTLRRASSPRHIPPLLTTISNSGPTILDHLRWMALSTEGRRSPE
ncbi:hypothetical protein E2C01_035462 [Portunus trituberculatus]|uniref:Uncharacterized protein n=1 Tax=Portunus trituberculatus TaxID=210409 RepID=A0A5B7F984_PORTR|nr:hypothetical protein [Portunus trituberculatus]